MTARGPLRKMVARPTSPVSYELPVGDERVPLGPCLGEPLRFEFDGEIRCIHCGRAIRKTFHQGYCYPCFTTLARTDRCLVRPELCHYARGTCREPEWGERHCMQPHTVYLASSSGLKVGVTRGLEPMGRWIDQGAVQGLAIRLVPSRLEAGLVEVALKRHVSDRTQWQRMLKGDPEPVDLVAERDRILAAHAASTPGELLPGEPMPDAEPVEISYPVLEHPTKVVSHDLDRRRGLSGTLLGIKGQYLILDAAVINVRKYQGYVVEVATGG